MNTLSVKHDFQGLRNESCRVVSADFLELRDGGVFHDGDKVIDELLRIVYGAKNLERRRRYVLCSRSQKELTSLEVHREHAKAELAALIRMNGSLSINNQQFVLICANRKCCHCSAVYSLLKDHYNVRSELLVRRKMKLKKNNVYIVRLKQETKRVLLDLDILDGLMFHSHVSDEIMGNAQKMRSYLRGAFMASGSVNNPETSRYHLEIYSIYEEHNQDICDMLNYYGLNARAP